MSVVDRERFLQGLSKSSVLDQSALDEWMAKISPDADATNLAKDLVAKKLLTSWQAKMLLKGASKLTMGNFLLTNRIAKSDYGDCFAAIHPQLSRNVSIQCLPAGLSDSKESKKMIFSLGSQLSELDHPNLLHIYDVDEEANRIYMVSEVGNALSLPEYLAENSALGCAAIAKLVGGSLRGINYAHSNGVIHGGITERSIFVKPKGDAKIGGLTRFAVSNALADEPAVAATDLAAIKEVAKKLLKSVPADERNSEEFASLKKGVVLIDDDLGAAMSTLDKLAESFVVGSDVLDSDIGLVAEIEELAPIENPDVFGQDGPFVAPRVPARTRTQPAAQAAPEKANFFKRNPVAVISAAVLGLVLLVGGGSVAAYSMFGTPVAANDATAENENVTSVALSSSAPEAADEVTDPDVNRRKIEALLGKALPIDEADKSPESKPEKTASKPAKKEAEQKTVSADERDAMTDPEANRKKMDDLLAKSSGDKKSDDKSAKDGGDTKEPAKPKKVTEVAVTEPVKAKAPPQEPEKKKQEGLKEGENPFAKFPASVDLPEVENTKQVTFAKLVLERRHLLGAEILSVPNAHRSKPHFSMVRSEEDRQTWDIGYATKKGRSSTVVAKLQKTPTELKFNWLPAAAKIKAINALRNCRFKLETPGNSKWLSLRKPVKIEGFKFDKQNGVVSVELDLPHLPSPASISGVVQKFQIKKLDSKNRGQRLSLDPATFSSGRAARMHLHEDSDRFLSIDVSANIRKKLTLQAAMVVSGAGQGGFTLKDPSTLRQQVTGPIRQMAQQAKQRQEQASKAAEGNKKLDKKEKGEYVKPFANAAKQAAGKAELTAYYEHVIPQLYGKDIPVEITYTLNSEHRIVLAYTVSDGERKKK